MIKTIKFALTEEEKKAIINCVQTINRDELDCKDCPFHYDKGCMLEILREIAEED